MLSKNKKINSNDLIFSLDIGTRTVIGIVGIYQDGKFKVFASCVKEHNKRNMYDGQIHDIEGVTTIVTKVKKELEEQLGLKLKKVSIAAAGRALKTCKIKIDKEIDSTIEINKNMIEALELEGVQKAQETIDKDKEKEKLRYYCIGYSVIEYYLDDSFIKNLEGHKGQKIGVNLLATFLPQIVIDSLYSVVNRAKLEVENITLEPIAAINVSIKENLRLLNLALVDIGAGTSDIAITKDGTIIAYAMTSIAGDEITERIARSYLMDFDSSEKLKITLNKQEEHEFYDIVGIKHNLVTKEIISKIQDVIDKLAKEICEKILEYNGKSPSAVFLIGGSSQIPLLKDFMSKYLGLPKERVAIRDVDSIEDVQKVKNELNGPDMVTPIGIALEGVNNKYKNFIEVYINNEKIRVFNTENVKVSDVLILTGYNPRRLVPKRGKEFVYFLNNEKKVIKGEIGEPAKIYVNNKLGNLNTKLNNSDFIHIVDATKGKDRVLNLYDCISNKEVIAFDGEYIDLIKNIKVNHKEIHDNIKLDNDDRIEIFKISTIQEILDYFNINENEIQIYRNEIEVDSNQTLSNGDIINIKYRTTPEKIDKDGKKVIKLNINGEQKVFPSDKDKFIFVDIFNYVEFDLSKPKGKLILKVNDKEAQYMQELKNGDNITIRWEK